MAGPFRVGVDIGGTFTDLILVDDATGAMTVGKLLTTPANPSRAVEDVLAE
jgi:N-methylhydantoinase A